MKANIKCGRRNPFTNMLVFVNALWGVFTLELGVSIKRIEDKCCLWTFYFKELYVLQVWVIKKLLKRF